MPKTKKTAKESHRISTSKPSKKRLRVQTSGDEFIPDSDEESEVSPVARPGRSDGARARVHRAHPEIGEKTKSETEVRKIRQKLRRAEAEKKKFEDKLLSKRNLLGQEREKVATSERKIEKLKKDCSKLKKSNEKLLKEKEDVLKESKEDNAKWRKKVDNLKQKTAGLELERAKLESKLSSLSLSGGDPEAGPSRGAAGGTGLFQDMMDNFRELAETQLQCAVCSELFVEATSINCGHTFCNYCITEWMKKKANCPVCRTDIKQSVQCKVLDEYADKLYDQFVGEGGKLQRQTLKEERSKIKKDNEAANAAKALERRERLQARRTNDLEMVNIVLNSRARRNDDDDSSLDSDATLELHLSDGGGQLSEPDFDTDSSLSVAYDDPSSDLNISTNNISEIFNNSRFDSDTDSSDEEFRTAHNDTDSVSDSSESDTSPSSSDTSSDSDSDI